MANVYAVKSGNWSDTTLWNTGNLPAAIDDVYANNFSVTIDINTQVLSIRTLSATSVTRGGRFFINNGISLSADVISGGSTVLTFLSASPNSCTLYGSITGGNGLPGSFYGVLNNSSGTINIFSPIIQSWSSTNSYGNASSNAAVFNNSTGTLNISTGQILPVFSRGVTNNSTGSVFITGNVFSGSEATVPNGVYNISTGSITVLGNVAGGGGTNAYGILNNSSGTITVFGNVSGSSTSNATGIYSPNLGGIINVVGDVRGGFTGIGMSGNVLTTYFNITGNVFGGSGSNIHGIQFPYGSIVTVRGDVYGGTGNGFWMNNAAGYPAMSAIVIGNIYNGTGGGTGISTGGSTTQFIWITGNILNNPGGGTSNTLAFPTSGTVDIVGNVIVTGGGSRLNHNGPGTINIRGNVIGSPFNINDHRGINISSTGTLNITGTVINDKSVNGYLILTSNSSGKVNIYGDVYGGTVANSVAVYGDTTNTASIITIYGNVYARDGGGVIQNQPGGTIIVYGDVYGGSGSARGALNNGTGTVIVSGSAIGGIGSAGYGALNNSTGILRVKRAVGNDWGLGYTTALAGTPGVFSSVQGSQTFVEELQCGPRGQWPTAGVIFFTPNTKATSMFETDTFQNYSLIQSNSADNLQPPVSSVRQSTTYNLGISTGTCIIPPASSVGSGVPVDNITGTATLTPTNVWNISASQITDSQSLGGRLKNTLTANAAEKIINSLNFS